MTHTHSYALGHRITAELWHGLTSNDLHMTVSDTGWGKNLWGNIFGQWYVGACMLIYDIRGKFHADELLPLLEKQAYEPLTAEKAAVSHGLLQTLSRSVPLWRMACTKGTDAAQIAATAMHK